MIATSYLESTIRMHGRGLLVNQCTQQMLLTRVMLGTEGEIVIDMQTWREYWAPVYNSAPTELVSAGSSIYNHYSRQSSS